jgi:DNA-directed RNA polymerase specialized sigma54-like protein
MTSLILLCLGGLILQLKAFKKENSNIEELAANFDLLANKETPTIWRRLLISIV